MRSLIIHNIDAGFGSNAVYEFMRMLIDRDDEIVLRVLGKETPVANELRDAEDFDLVVISSGDGTATNALYALRNRGIRTCIFPSGTANLLFNNIGSAIEPAAIATACRGDLVAQTDLGEFSWQSPSGERFTRGFGIMAGLGFDARLMADARPNKKMMGEAAYFAAALANTRPDVVTFRITADGETKEYKGIGCIVANAAMIQADIDLVPGCVMDDGMLDIIVLEAEDATQLIFPIVAGLVDRTGASLGRPHLTTFKAREVLVESSIPMPFEIDGEAYSDEISSYEARVLPGCNRLVIDRMSRYASSAESNA